MLSETRVMPYPGLLGGGGGGGEGGTMSKTRLVPSEGGERDSYLVIHH